MDIRKYFLAAHEMHKLHMLRRIIIQNQTSELELYYGQLPTMEYIARHDGCTQVELAEEMMVSPASVALTTKRLQKAGLVEKKNDEENLRCKRLSVTPKGRELAQKCRKIHDGFDRQIFKDFSEEDMDQFISYLDRMVYNITGQENGAEETAFTLQTLKKLLKEHHELIGGESDEQG